MLIVYRQVWPDPCRASWFEEPRLEVLPFCRREVAPLYLFSETELLTGPKLSVLLAHRVEVMRGATSTSAHLYSKEYDPHNGAMEQLFISKVDIISAK